MSASRQKRMGVGCAGSGWVGWSGCVSGPARVYAPAVETVQLGEITCRSGELVLMDGGYLGLWSGERSPDEVGQTDDVPAVDLEVVGPDANAAARSFDRQSGRSPMSRRKPWPPSPPDGASLSKC